MSAILSALFYILLSLVDVATPINMAISPAHIHFKAMRNDQRAIPITCDAQEPITECQFKVDDNPHFNPREINENTLSNDYKFFGNDSDPGSCGVVLRAQQFVEGEHEVGCRVRDRTSGWVYASTALIYTHLDEIPHNITTRMRLVTPGSNATFSVNTGTNQSDECSIKNDQWQSWMTLCVDNQTCTSNKTIGYTGRGIYWGDCGVILKNITNEFNGKLWFRLRYTSQGKMAGAFDFVRLVVASPPAVPFLNITTRNRDGGHSLHARCMVSGSKPPAKVTWHLGSEDITRDLITPKADDRWVWPHEDQTVAHRLIERIDKTDFGKELWCTAQNEVFPEPVSSNRVIIEKTSRLSRSTINLYAVIIGLVTVIVILVSGGIVVYAWYAMLCCFSNRRSCKGRTRDPSHNQPDTASNSLGKDETYVHLRAGLQVPRDSGFYQDPAYAGMEYYEIRESAVDRCLEEMEREKRDQMEFNKCNSMYQATESITRNVSTTSL